MDKYLWIDVYTNKLIAGIGQNQIENRDFSSLKHDISVFNSITKSVENKAL